MSKFIAKVLAFGAIATLVPGGVMVAICGLILLVDKLSELAPSA